MVGQPWRLVAGEDMDTWRCRRRVRPQLIIKPWGVRSQLISSPRLRLDQPYCYSGRALLSRPFPVACYLSAMFNHEETGGEPEPDLTDDEIQQISTNLNRELLAAMEEVAILINIRGDAHRFLRESHAALLGRARERADDVRASLNRLEAQVRAQRTRQREVEEAERRAAAAEAQRIAEANAAAAAAEATRVAREAAVARAKANELRRRERVAGPAARPACLKRLLRLCLGNPSVRCASNVGWRRAC